MKRLFKKFGISITYSLIVFLSLAILLRCSDKPTKSVLFTEAAISPEFPDPVKDSVVFRYALPVDSVVKLRIINRYGQRVFTLVKSEYSGYRSIVWHLQDAEGRRVGADIYRGKIEIGDFFRKEFNVKVE